MPCESFFLHPLNLNLSQATNNRFFSIFREAILVKEKKEWRKIRNYIYIHPSMVLLYISLLVSPATYVWMTILTFLHHEEKCCQLGWQMGGGTHLTDKPPQIGPNCALIRATCNAYYGQSRPSIWTFKRRLRNKQFQNQKLQITWRLKKLFGNDENLIWLIFMFIQISSTYGTKSPTDLAQ